jgi:hypothetical protein
MKHLNDKAVADAMLKKREITEIDPVFENAVKEALAARAKNITE